MLRPAGSVSLYFPNRSTMPARACGMIRTVLASSTMTKAKNRTAIPSRYGVTGCSQSGSGWLGVGGRSRLERGVDRVHVDGRTLHGEHLDGRAGLDGQRAVVRDGRPDLTGELDPPGLMAGDLLGDDGLAADHLAVPELQLRAALEVLDEVGPDQREHRHRRASGEQHLEDDGS